MIHTFDPILGTLMILMGLQILNLILLVFYYIKLKQISEHIEDVLDEDFHEYEYNVHPIHTPLRNNIK